MSAQSDLVPHLSTRREIYLYPNIHDAEYVVLDNFSDYWPLSAPQFARALDELWNNPLYTLDWQEGGYGIFKRKSTPPIQNPLAIGFAAGGQAQIELAGYDLPKAVLAPGETLTVGMYWRTLTPIETRRIKFRSTTSLQLVGPDGKAVAQVDKEPWDGIVSNDRIAQGVIYFDRYALEVPANAPPGRYTLVTAIYSYYSKRPWTVFDEAGQSMGQFSVPLASIEVGRR